MRIDTRSAAKNAATITVPNEVTCGCGISTQRRLSVRFRTDRPTATSQTCATYPKLGEDCSVYQRCNDIGTYCDGSVCRTPKVAGQPCHTDTECASLYCDTGTTLTCMAPPTCPLRGAAPVAARGDRVHPSTG